MEWQTLSPLQAREWDTPELVNARKACNQEITGILEERQRIESETAALTRSDIVNLDFNEIEAKRNGFQRDRLRLLQRELKFRQQSLKEFIKQDQEAAEKKGRELEQQLPTIESKIAKDLESIGYLKPKGITVEVPGTWEPSMIRKHSAYLECTRLQESAWTVSSNYDPARTNVNVIETLQTTLSKALTQLVG